MSKNKIEEVIKNNLKELSLADLKVVENEIRTGPYPVKDEEFMTLFILVDEEITKRIYSLFEG